MSEKIATEKELFILGGGEEINKPSNYDINRCVTKTRSTAFKSITVNLTAYQELQLIPVSLFGKVIMADTIQVEIEYYENSGYTSPEFDIVLLTDGKEIHCADLPYVDKDKMNIFKTYEWSYNESFVTKTEREPLNNGKERSIQNINLKKVKELMSNHNNATIQFKAKWYDVIPTDPTIKYTVKLLANGGEKYKAQNSIQLLTHEYFSVDVFFRKLFEITYDRKNDLISVLNNSEPEKTATFEYDLLVKKNLDVLINKHMITNSAYFHLTLHPKDFNQYDRITFEVSDFKIKLSMSDGTEKIIIPNFTETKVKTIEKNGCTLSVTVNDPKFYMAQVDILEDIPIYPKREIFKHDDLTLSDFNSIQHAFEIRMSSAIEKSTYSYFDVSPNNIGRQQTIDLF